MPKKQRSVWHAVEVPRIWPVTHKHLKLKMHETAFQYIIMFSPRCCNVASGCSCELHNIRADGLHSCLECTFFTVSPICVAYLGTIYGAKTSLGGRSWTLCSVV